VELRPVLVVVVGISIPLANLVPCRGWIRAWWVGSQLRYPHMLSQHTACLPPQSPFSIHHRTRWPPTRHRTTLGYLQCSAGAQLIHTTTLSVSAYLVQSGSVLDGIPSRLAAKATDENQTSENWEILLNLCDKVSEEGEQGCAPSRHPPSNSDLVN
jgi:hypothetical protein